MPMPNPSVIFALFESYITMRKASWKLNELPDGKISIPEFKPEEDPRIKIDICVDILNQVNKAKEIKDWIRIAHSLHKHDIAETARYGNRGIMRAWGIIGSNEITSVLDATRAYIVHLIRNEADYLKQCEAINQQQLNLEKDIDALSKHAANHDKGEIDRASEKLAEKLIEKHSLTENEDKLSEFFLECISKYDAKPIGNAAVEKDINDYIGNVEKGFRPAKLCRALLNTIHQQNVDAALPTPAPLESIIKEDPIVIPKKSKERSPVKARVTKEDNNSTDSDEVYEAPRKGRASRHRATNKKPEASIPVTLGDYGMFPPLHKEKKDPNPRVNSNRGGHNYETRSKRGQ